MSSFAPYQAINSGMSVNDVCASLNRTLYDAYGTSYSRALAGRLEMDPLAHYERLLLDLKTLPGVEFRTHHSVATAPRPEQGVVVTIRHDVDIDVITALELARIEARCGIPATYYLLHTSTYYGTVQGLEFARHDCMAYLYRQMYELGHEIGLHTDPLNLYQNFNIDGAAAVCAEIDWLRGHGIEVAGSCAHNSAPVYGAENRAIFKGQIKPWTYQAQIERGLVPDISPEADHVEFNGVRTPLQVLSERELGLDYEGLDVQEEALDDEGRPEGGCEWEYAALRSANAWNSKMTKARIRDSARFGEWKAAYDIGVGNKVYFATHEDVVRSVRELPPGAHALINVHPVYYGRRYAPETGPVVRKISRARSRQAALGWPTYVPDSLVALRDDTGAYPNYQSLNEANELGMLDLPVDEAELEPSERRAAGRPLVALLGGTNMDGATVNLDSQINRQLAIVSSQLLGREVDVVKFAAPDMGLGRLVGWFDALHERYEPDVVVLRLGADEAVQTMPVLWSRLTGYHPSAAPGAYLEPGEDGVSLNSPHPLADLQRLKGDEQPRVYNFAGPWPEEHEGALALPNLPEQSEMLAAVRAVLADLVRRIRETGCKVVLLVEECGETAGLWSDPESGQRALTAFAPVIDTLIRDLDIAVVNPYGVLQEDFEHGARIFWGQDRVWSEHSHRRAALELAHVLTPMLEVE